MIPFRGWGPKNSSHNGRKSQGITPESLDGQPPPSPHNPPSPLPPSRGEAASSNGPKREQIDKAFRIATPMRKASWTKRFAEGWGGAAGCEWRWWQRWGGLEGMGRRCEREIAPKARSVREAAPSLAGRRGARVSESAFQVTCPSGSRHAETRILAKEPRPATTAVGTSRQGRVAIRRLVDSSIGRFRQLAQRLREA